MQMFIKLKYYASMPNNKILFKDLNYKNNSSYQQFRVISTNRIVVETIVERRKNSNEISY